MSELADEIQEIVAVWNQQVRLLKLPSIRGRFVRDSKDSADLHVYNVSMALASALDLGTR